MLCAAAFLAVLGYVLVVIAIVFAIAAAFESEKAWIAIMGVAAFLHIGVAVGLVFAALRRLRVATFDDTFDQFKKDEQWLNQPDGKN